MKGIKISISTSLFFIIIATSTFTIFSISALWVFSEIRQSNKTINEIKKSYVLEQRKQIKYEVKQVVALINYSRKNNKNKTTYELQEEILDHVSSIRLDHGGYIFINTYDGHALIYDGVKIIGEKDITNITDSDGLKVFETELKTIREEDGGFFEYKFKRLDTFTEVPKLSYVFGDNGWEWIIGAGIYLDDLSDFIINEKEKHQKLLTNKVIYIFILFIILSLVLIGVTLTFSKLIRREFSVFNSFLNKSPILNITIDEKKLHIREFQNMAHSANVMIRQNRKSDKLLKKERDNAKKYINIAGVIILALDKNGDITLINKKGCETLGYNEEEIIGKNWFSNFIPPKDKHRATTNYAKVIAGNSKSSFNIGESNIINRSGQERIIDWQNTIIVDDNGSITGTLNSGQDITETKLLENFYNESEEKYKLLFNNSSDPVLIIGNHNTFIDCNNAAVEILGLTNKDELTGKYPDKISPEHQDDGKLSIIKAVEMIAKARREGFNKFEWIHLDKNKKPFYVDVSLTVIPISGIEYLYVVWRDITEKKKQHKELILAKEKAERSDNIKTSFLHNLQHEIRTPLNAILGFSQLLKQQGLKPKEVQEYYEYIISSGNQLTKIIDEIIDYSRLHSGIINLNKEAIELKKLTIEIFKENYYRAQNKSIKFTITTCSSKSNSVIISDVKRLKQIMSNLIENAFKFTEKGMIDMGYDINESDITFYVSDTGVGIAEQHFNTIFEKFSRLAQKEVEKVYGGMGIGLSISKSIIGFLGGKIWVNSRVGKGSKFSFSIPYHPVDVYKKLGAKTLKDKTISIVTTKTDRYNKLAEIIRKSDAKIIHHKNGMEAIEFCQNECLTDLVIIDISLPQMNSITSTIAIKAINKELPIIALITDDPKNLSQEDALTAGCNDCIEFNQTEHAINLTLFLYLKPEIMDIT